MESNGVIDRRTPYTPVQNNKLKTVPLRSLAFVLRGSGRAAMAKARVPSDALQRLLTQQLRSKHAGSKEAAAPQLRLDDSVSVLTTLAVQPFPHAESATVDAWYLTRPENSTSQADLTPF